MNNYYKARESLKIDFQSSILSGSPTQMISFSGTSTGGTPTNYSWKFTNTITDDIYYTFDDTPTLALPLIGLYDVELFAGNTENSDVKIKEDYINIDIDYVLDVYSGCTGAFSLRKIKSDYSGHCLTVRRASDGTLFNIGFVNGVLDVATLEASILAGDDGYVTTWYDQSGFGRDATQVDTTLQPLIVENGVVTKQGTLPAIKFTGSMFNTPHLGISGNSPRTLLGVVKNNISAATTGIGTYLSLYGAAPSPAAGGGWSECVESGGLFTRGNGNCQFLYPSPYNSLSHSFLMTFYSGFEWRQIEKYQNGTIQGKGTFSSTSNLTLNTQVTGAYIGNFGWSTPVYFTGTMQEIVTFNVDHNDADKRYNLTKHYKDYYDIT